MYSFLFYLKRKVGRGEEENLFSLKEHMKTCCYKYFNRNIQKKPEVFVSGKDNIRWETTQLCVCTLLRPRKFFSILIFKQNEKIYKFNT